MVLRSGYDSGRGELLQFMARVWVAPAEVYRAPETPHLDARV
jgi:hypothetical protein